MKRSLQMSAAIVSALALWVMLTWPLPRYAREGIPYSVHAPVNDTPRAMVSGDHLQLMYHFWLWRDMVVGQTPWMYNLYEFNTGDDAERYRPGAYFAPFSWAFTVGDLAGGRAVGWHLATGLSVLIAFWGSWRLARRYTSHEAVAWAVALIVTAFPYRWHNLMGGSPTGFGMAWTPVLMLGLDRALRDGSWRGGWLACVAILFSGWAEKHVMFFNVLLIPAWSALVWVNGRPWEKQQLVPSLRRACAALPVVLGVILTYLYATLYTAHLGSSAMAKGRGGSEIAAFSPQLSGYWDRHAAGISSQIFPGWVLPVVLAIVLVAWIMRAVRGREASDRSHLLVVPGLAILVTLVIFLATGPHGRGVGRDLFEAAREFLPPYRMIRQSAKIMLVLPALLVPLLALGFSALARPRALALAAALAVLVDVAEWIRPSISLLDREQGAYAAVRQDAEMRNIRPHALVIPLWPGDTHASSVYEYFASLYRIPMANGYSPVVSRAYVEQFFARYRTVNQGSLTADQVSDLWSRGIRYVLLHEDLFPEKVSPFPVACTLQRLLQNPQVELLARAGSVWAFRLRPEPISSDVPGPGCWYFPTRRWEAESAHRRGGVLTQDDAASGGQAVRLATSGDKVELELSALAGQPEVAWWIRLRGAGRLLAVTYAGTNEAVESELSIAATTWTWQTVPQRPVLEFGPVGLALRGREGAVEVDRVVLSGSAWPLETGPGWSLRLPASAFFHAGGTGPDGASVHLRPRHDPAGVILYGPRLPLSAGEYEIEAEFHADAPAGTVVGSLLAGRDDPSASSVVVKSGAPARVRCTQSGHDEFYTGFSFNRAAPVELRALTIRRVDAP